MVENVNYKKLVGNICLHKDLVPERRFLRRNLRVILDSHERQLHGQTHDGSYEDMIANEKRTSGWDFPTREMLEDLMKGQNPVLQLDSLQIRHPRSKASIRKRLRYQTNGSDGLDWLPDPNSDFRLPCRVGISVLDTRTSRMKQTDVQTAAAVIVENRSDGSFPTFNIELRKPFLVELDKFFVVAETGTNGFRHWKRTITAKYALEITIQCEDSDDTAELLSRVEEKHITNYHETLANEGVLRTVWETLPECPPEGHLLPLKRAKGHKSVELEYKLDVSMGWARKRESPLQRYNQILTEAQNATRQLPTPSASDDLDKQPKKFVISYNYQDGLQIRTTSVEGLFCPFCRSGREHSSFERLQLHLMTYHDHFKFDQENRSNEDSSTIRHVLWISLADEETDKVKPIEDGPIEEIRMNWVRPSRPFDINGYVRGTDRWGRQGKGRSGTRKGRAARDRDRDYVSVPQPRPIRKRPAPEEVEDLPEYRPKKRQVPNVPGVTFYHTASKQALNPGDYVAESDDYVDESWLAQNQTFGLEELGISGTAQKFTNAFNKHLAREQSDSSILTKEALVRFARLHQEHLQDIEWQRQFRAKLNQLRDAGIIGDETVSYCVRQLRAISEAKTTDVEMESVAGADAEDDGSKDADERVNGEGGLLQRIRKKWTGDKIASRDSNGSKGKARMVNGNTTSDMRDINDTSVKGVEASHTNPAEVCPCGSSASHARGSIACIDPVSIQSTSMKLSRTKALQLCGRKDFHLSCVGLDRRIQGWRCAECSA